MTAAASSTALATIQPAFTDAERLALAGFLAGYRGLTREAYTLDLRQFTGWCRARSLPLFAVRRTDIETFARELEARGRARATVTRRLCTIAGFYKYAVEEELIEHSPAAHVRRPRLDYESHATALDRNELGGLLVAAGLGPPAEHALISLLALNGLRVSEATGADIEHLGLERGHRTLVITRKGGKVVTIPCATTERGRAWTGMLPQRSSLGQPDSPHRSICLAALRGQADPSLGTQFQRSPTVTSTATANRRSAWPLSPGNSSAAKCRSGRSGAARSAEGVHGHGS
jgi:integrase